MKKIILILTLLILFTACQNAVSEINKPNVNNDQTETVPEDPNAKFRDSLGEHSFNGAEFKIQVFENASNNLLVDTESETGDPYNDTMYRRNREIEERFNVVIKQIITNDDALA
ncbi:MAG: hypothetical protein FWF15_08750 [Oscillospiraceae bacterium]|nr:hypothetical protein [Oscillospiraceae bacterium]